MKFFGAATATCAVVSILVTLSSCSGWSREKPSAKLSDLAHIALLTPSGSGFDVGYSGAVEYTENGGRNWIAGTNSSVCLFAAEITRSGTCFATGNGSNFVTSANGGKNWQRKENIGGSTGKAVSFADDTTGWAASTSWLGQTETAGSAWTTLPLPADFGLVETISCAGKDSGYALSMNGRLFRTADGGASWTERTAPFPKSDESFKPLWGRKTQGAALRFTGESGVAAAIGKAGGKAALLVRTTADGGATWAKAKKFPFDLAPLACTIDPDGNVTVFNADTTATLIARK